MILTMRLNGKALILRPLVIGIRYANKYLLFAHMTKIAQRRAIILTSWPRRRLERCSLIASKKRDKSIWYPRIPCLSASLFLFQSVA